MLDDVAARERARCLSDMCLLQGAGAPHQGVPQAGNEAVIGGSKPSGGGAGVQGARRPLRTLQLQEGWRALALRCERATHPMFLCSAHVSSAHCAAQRCSCRPNNQRSSWRPFGGSADSPPRAPSELHRNDSGPSSQPAGKQQRACSAGHVGFQQPSGSAGRQARESSQGTQRPPFPTLATQLPQPSYSSLRISQPQAPSDPPQHQPGCPGMHAPSPPGAPSLRPGWQQLTGLARRHSTVPECTTAAHNGTALAGVARQPTWRPEQCNALPAARPASRRIKSVFLVDEDQPQEEAQHPVQQQGTVSIAQQHEVTAAAAVHGGTTLAGASRQPAQEQGPKVRSAPAVARPAGRRIKSVFLVDEDEQQERAQPLVQQQGAAGTSQQHGAAAAAVAAAQLAAPARRGTALAGVGRQPVEQRDALATARPTSRGIKSAFLVDDYEQQEEGARPPAEQQEAAGTSQQRGAAAAEAAPLCAYCHQPGHMLRECAKLMAKKEWEK